VKRTEYQPRTGVPGAGGPPRGTPATTPGIGARANWESGYAFTGAGFVAWFRGTTGFVSATDGHFIPFCGFLPSALCPLLGVLVSGLMSRCTCSNRYAAPSTRTGPPRSAAGS